MQKSSLPFLSRKNILLNYTKLSAKIYNLSYEKFLGNSPIILDRVQLSFLATAKPNRKMRNIPWLLQQITFGFLYGIISCIWCCMYADEASLINYFIYVVGATASVVQLGVGRKMYFETDETVFGLNLLLDFHKQLIEGILII